MQVLAKIGWPEGAIGELLPYGIRPVTPEKAAANHFMGRQEGSLSQTMPQKPVSLTGFRE